MSSPSQISDLKSAVVGRMNIAAGKPQVIASVDPAGLAWPVAGPAHATTFQWTSDVACAFFFATLSAARDFIAARGLDETACAIPLCLLAAWTNGSGSSTGATAVTNQAVTVP